MSRWFTLPTDWTLSSAGPDEQEQPAQVASALHKGVPATVPGCVHTDLLTAGLIPDPYIDSNENALRWIGMSDWRYSTAFRWPDVASPEQPDRVDLVCEGLDTFATVDVNGTTVGVTQNAHRSYRFPIYQLLRNGQNEVTVTFESAVRRARELSNKEGDLPRVVSIVPEPYNFVRKMACNFGWDWGPELVTAGITKPIRLHRWRTARLAQVRPHVSVDLAGGAAGEQPVGRVRVDVELERAGIAREVTVTARVAGRVHAAPVAAHETVATVELEVPDAQLWWPRGFGRQPLYELDVRVEADGQELDRWSQRIGFRNVELDTSLDEIGSAFTLVVNNTPVFVRGANWIPDDCFPTRIDASRYRDRIDQATAADVNLLRVWGGGMYETAEFYEACDERGILVWQDFAFACAAYPEDVLRDEVEAEARENVKRLMPHASLVLWCGNNENFLGWHDWNWQDQIGDRSWGLGFYRDLLPKVVAETDPSRPYWPGSPYSGSMDVHPNADAHGCSHVWDVWNERDYTGYRDHVPRFVAEFGYQGPPAWNTLRRAITDDPISPHTAGVRQHQKAENGSAKLARGLDAHFPAARTGEDWHFAAQLNQARAISVGVEHFRSFRGRCMGTVVWQLNDCWPVISWSAIDGDGRRKPMWYAMRHAYRDRLLTFQPRGEELALVAVNDSHSTWNRQVQVERRRFDGTLLAAWTSDLMVEPQSAATHLLPANIATPANPARELLVVGAGPNRATWFFARDSELDYPAASFAATNERDGGDLLVHLTARSLLRDVTILADRVDAGCEVDEMLITLLPGETHSFRFVNVPEDAIARVDDPLVVRTANDLVVARVPVGKHERRIES